MRSRLLNPRRWPSVVFAGIGLIVAFLLSGMITSLGMRFYGSQEAFQAVHHRVLPWLMLWRLALYAALGWYWLKHFKPRLLTRIADDTAQRSAANQRLRRLEILLIIVLAIIEVSNLVNWAGGASA